MAIRRLWRTKASDCGVFKENKVASMPGESNTTRTTVYRIPWAIIRIPSDSLKEMADDLARKKSAFWNCKVDAFLCPVCTFLYALSPLGFQLIGDKFLFVNTNKNVKELIGNNRKNSRIEQEKEKQDNEKYPAWFARIMNTVLSEKTRELGNIQIILKLHLKLIIWILILVNYLQNHNLLCHIYQVS